MRRAADFEHLYVLNDPSSNRFFRGRLRFPPEVDPNALLTGELAVTQPLTIGRAEGRMLADIVWTDHVAVILISGRLAEAFRATGFSGWSTYPVRMEAEGAIQDYFGLTITGRCGPLDRTRGEWVHKDDEPGRFLRGIFFDEQSWDGADFFVPARTVYAFVTQPVRDCLQRMDVKNVGCERLSDAMTAEIVIRNTPKLS